jgi:hypothetical protein
MFQANPKSYGVRAALARIAEHDQRISWLTTRYRNEIRSGNCVYLWEAGPTGGIRAIGTVIAEPAIRTDDDWELQFARDRARLQVPDWRVVIRIDQILSQPVTRRELEDHPILKTLDILNFWQHTNFRVSPEQAEAVAGLVSKGVTG